MYGGDGLFVGQLRQGTIDQKSLYIVLGIMFEDELVSVFVCRPRESGRVINHTRSLIVSCTVPVT